MADLNVQRRKRAGQMTWLWMALALVLVAGFLVWLAVSSEPTPEVAVVEDDAVDASAQTLTLAEFARTPQQYAGQLIRVTDVPVASRMGSQAFWTQFPNEVPFLVKLSQALIDGGSTVQSGQTVHVTGRVMTMTDSVLAAWQETGAITDEMERAEAEFATAFLDAVQVTPAR
jgi:hypothetical protein